MKFLFYFRFFKLMIVILYSFCSIAKIEEKIVTIFSQNNHFQEIIDQSEEKILKELIIEILDLDISDKKLKEIEGKISSQSKKIILLSKIIQTHTVSEKSKKNDSKSQDHSIFELPYFESKVLIRFSRETLKKILITENLFYKNTGSNRVIVLIEFKDKINKKIYRWWQNPIESFSDFFLIKEVNLFYNQLQSIFIKHGFYSSNPIFSQYEKMISENLRYSSINPKTAQSIAKFFNSQLMILGSITLDSSLLSDMNEVAWNLSLYNSTHLRKLDTHKFKAKIQDTSWKFLTQPHHIYWAKNFATEMNSIYQTGVLSTQLFTIEVKGDLNFLERKSIKEHLINQVSGIKNLTETVITKNSIFYQSNIEDTSQKLFQSVKKINILDFKLSFFLVEKNYILIKVKK